MRGELWGQGVIHRQSPLGGGGGGVSQPEVTLVQGRR